MISGGISSPSSPFGLCRARFAFGYVAAPRVAEGEAWWSQAGSNRRPLACHASALPAELWPLNFAYAPWATHGFRENPEHSSGPISSLLVAADVADDVGDVLVAFFLVGDEGRIIIVVVFDGLVDLDVVFRFRHDRLALPGILLALGFLGGHQLFG